MNRYEYWTTDSGTMELPSIHRGRPYWEAATVELNILDLRPSVPVRYQRPNRLRRLLGSPAANHLRAAARSTFWPAAIGAGLLVAFFLLHYFQGLTPVTGGIR